MSTTPPTPITKHSDPMLKNWPWTEVELAWVAARDAQWQAYATAARADLEAENKRLREALEAIAECCDEDHAARDYASRQTEIRGMARSVLKETP